MRQSILWISVGLIAAACSPAPPDDLSVYSGDKSAIAAPLRQAENELTQVETGTTPALDVPAVPEDTSGISKSQDFDETKSRYSIEADADRIARLKTEYTVAETEALPTRRNGVNLAAYAVANTHGVGERKYGRGNASRGDSKRNCRKFSDLQEAQTVFLSNGGPERDPRGLDADGDGYACGWDPESYRALLGL